MDKGRNYALDVLRIIATIFIVFHHYQQMTGAYFEGGINFFNGDFPFELMVEFFFILSGFFMCKYIKMIREDKISFKSYIIKRAKRLLPLVALSLIIYVALMFMHEAVLGYDWPYADIDIWGVIIGSLGMQAGWVFANPKINNPVWYISVLLLCCCLFFILTKLAKKWNISSRYFYFFMILLGCGIQAYNINLPFMNAVSARGFCAFFTGILLGDFINSTNLNYKHYAMASLAIVILTLFMIFVPKSTSAHLPYLMTFVYFPSIIILFCSKMAQKIFNFKAIGVLGQITYGIYIWHAPLFLLMTIILARFDLGINLTSIKSMLAFTIITTVAGVFSFYHLERPINKFLERKDCR